MKKLLTIICLLVSVQLYSEPTQDWTRVSCPKLNHSEIYERISFIVDYLQGNINYDDGHQMKIFFEVPSDNCYEVIHILDVVIYDNAFVYLLDQSISFDNEMGPCINEVREQVRAFEEIMRKIPSI